jgi:hypothetical protein
MKKKDENKNSLHFDKELTEIKNFVKIIATQITVNELKEFASTDKQKAIWVLCDGKLKREEIASKVGVTGRAVSYFIENCKIYGLIEEEKEKGGHPKRVINYVPSSWKKLVKKKTTGKQKPKPSVEKA